MKLIQKSIKANDRKREEYRRCSLCLFQINLPLQICKNGHFVCASCARRQLDCEEKKMDIVWKDGKLVCESTWPTLVQCMLCQTKCAPKYPGHVVSHLMDPFPCLSCPTCKNKYSAENIAMHVVNCSLFVCPYCKKNVFTIEEVSMHVYTECNKIECNESTCGFIGNKLAVETHRKEHDNVALITIKLQKEMQQLYSNLEKERNTTNDAELVCKLLVLQEHLNGVVLATNPQT